jgi:hypothetical protein
VVDSPWNAWKVALAVVLLAAICVSACAHAPRRKVPGSELRRLVISALALYAVGGAASLTRHPALAGLAYAAGIAVCALAAWLSRGRDAEDPPGGGGGGAPIDEPPPPEPDGAPAFDWTAFEREFRTFAARRGQETSGRS